jgi:FkbH-like protein
MPVAQDPQRFLDGLREGLRQRFAGILIVQSVACPSERLFGNFDARLKETQRARIDHFNSALIDRLGNSPDVLFDVAGIAHSVGTQRWFDPVQWYLAKLPFAQQFVPLYADHCARLLGALVGRSRKCLVLDLDNTLWGGVIGDDGLDGIVVGQGSASGEAFLEVQRMALELRERGIVLAISSKNDDRIARAAFRNHPDMLLREEHIAVFQANWNDKATNLQATARALNIGIDSLVLIDDNPAERALVRQLLPEVAVPELGDDPAYYRRVVLAAGYFESTALSAEDRQRAGQYQANFKRVLLQGATKDLEAYLRSLDMVITFGPFDAAGRARITQLINKTNQFNLTTQRYNEAQVEAMETSSDVWTLQARLADTFGDNGMISVLICRHNGDRWEIDTWLMSCRVLGRRVEDAVLNEVVEAAARAGVRTLVGLYRPTERNDMVREHYRKLGFIPTEIRSDGATISTLDIASYDRREVPMRIVRMAPTETVFR